VGELRADGYGDVVFTQQVPARGNS
jgi:hypothetical protein